MDFTWAFERGAHSNVQPGVRGYLIFMSGYAESECDGRIERTRNKRKEKTRLSLSLSRIVYSFGLFLLLVLPARVFRLTAQTENNLNFFWFFFGSTRDLTAATTKGMNSNSLASQMRQRFDFVRKTEIAWRQSPRLQTN